MKIFITTEGDRSVGVDPVKITIDGMPDPIDREEERRLFHAWFGTYLDDMSCGVRFEDECIDCGRVDHHSNTCPIIAREEA